MRKDDAYLNELEAKSKKLDLASKFLVFIMLASLASAIVCLFSGF